MFGDQPTMQSIWVMTPDERQAIARGANISLLVLGHVHPPVAIEVAEDIKILDTDRIKP